jgi:hypothetical protein
MYEIIDDIGYNNPNMIRIGAKSSRGNPKVICFGENGKILVHINKWTKDCLSSPYTHVPPMAA